MDDGILMLGVVLSLFIRWGVSLFPHSGQGKPPMFGDYEAQRHWQEITYNLPIRHWYINSTRNDLQYWGLDYPPLTAYHSYLCAYVASKIDPSWVTLFTSRGTEGYMHKLFMRYSVFAVDILVYMTAVVMYWFYGGQRVRARGCAVTVMLLYPGLILIDHGHFQYNCVSLGLTLWAMFALERGYDVFGAIAFSLALNYKQMELYHAFPFFCYLFGKCLRRKPLSAIANVVKLGLVVTAVFALCWLPYLWNWKLFLRVLNRLFPFSRGLYEDKVANVWCTISLLVKLRTIFSIPTLIKISALITLVGIVPSSLNLLLKPSISRFKLALVNTSLVFFLFSFQVHEKSILLAALPVCCLLPAYPLLSIWFLLISVFSMFPLLIKDGLVMPTFACCAIFYILAYNAYLKRFLKLHQNDAQKYLALSFYLSMAGALVSMVLMMAIPPPAKYPDIHTMIGCIYSCVHFIGFAGYFHWKQLTLEDDDQEFTAAEKKHL